MGDDLGVRFTALHGVEAANRKRDHLTEDALHSDPDKRRRNREQKDKDHPQRDTFELSDDSSEEDGGYGGSNGSANHQHPQNQRRPVRLRDSATDEINSELREAELREDDSIHYGPDEDGDDAGHVLDVEA